MYIKTSNLYVNFPVGICSRLLPENELLPSHGFTPSSLKECLIFGPSLSAKEHPCPSLYEALASYTSPRPSFDLDSSSSGHVKGFDPNMPVDLALLLIIFTVRLPHRRAVLIGIPDFSSTSWVVRRDAFELNSNMVSICKYSWPESYPEEHCKFLESHNIKLHQFGIEGKRWHINKDSSRRVI